MSQEQTLQSTFLDIEEGLKGGTLGVAATFLPTAESVFFNADMEFPTASVIKIAIVTEVFLQVESGDLSPKSLIEIPETAFVPGSGVLAQLTPGLTLPLGDLATLTINVSDNTASNLCLAAVGGPGVVNARMQNVWGMKNTTIHRPIKFALEPGDPRYTATSTPRDMQALVQHLGEATLIPQAVCDQVLRRMGYVVDGELLPRYLDVNPYAADQRLEAPPFVVRHKGGAVNGVRADAGLISRGDEVLAVCVFTKDVPDSRWTSTNLGSEAVARVGEALCQHFFKR
ncbi:MAG: serine hydrolase [Armatimonadota bacterium]